MRIFQILDASANAFIPGNQTWLRNLYEPLGELGHQVVLFPAHRGLVAMLRRDARLRADFSQRLLETFRREHAQKPFDLVFAYLMDGMVDPGALDEIRKSNVLTVNFSCNNAHQFYLVDELAPHFDYNLHSEKDARAKFLAIGAEPLWWPMASNPKYFRPLDLPRTIAVSFVGMNYALRARYIAHLLENGIDVHAYGWGWHSDARLNLRATAKRYLLILQTFLARAAIQRARYSALLADHDFRRALATRFPQNLHAPIADDDQIALYSQSQMSLGFLEVYDHHDPSRVITRHLHLREFEAPMSGALYCTGYIEELAEFFEPDREVIVYRNAEELLDKTRYYLAHPELGVQVRRAGYTRARQDHTYHRRYQTLFAQIGLGAKACRA